MEPISNGRCPDCGFNTADYQPVPTALLPETVLNNTYILGRVLGKGGFGITYIGRNLAKGLKGALWGHFPTSIATRDAAKDCYVRPMAETCALYDNGVRKFHDEAAMLAQLRDIPAIVQIHDFFYENGTAYIVMEYIQGVTIEQVVKKQGRLDVGLVLTIYYPILLALDAVHQRGLLHRDISPCNILLDDHCNARLIDFGASRAFSYEMSSDMSVILKNGSAPIEQYTRAGRHGPWEDIYALSASIYYSLTGRIPPAATDRLIFDTLEPISSFGVDIPARLEQIILKGMAVKTIDRYRSAVQMCNDIDSAIIGTAKPVSPGCYLKEDHVQSNRGKPWPKVFLFALLALIGFGLIGVLAAILLFSGI